jgi:glycopeptide antibiotics resistance protein
MRKFALQYWQSLLWFVGILYGSFAPKQTLDQRLFLFENQDKVVHGFMYLGFIFLCLNNTKKAHQITTKMYALFFVGIAALSLSIEFLQPILSNRTCDMMDFLANLIGAIIGLLSFYISFKPSRL